MACSSHKIHGSVFQADCTVLHSRDLIFSPRNTSTELSMSPQELLAQLDTVHAVKTYNDPFPISKSKSSELPLVSTSSVNMAIPGKACHHDATFLLTEDEHCHHQEQPESLLIPNL